MNRCIYCDDNISIWGDTYTYFGNYRTNDLYIVDNKTRQPLLNIYGDDSFTVNDAKGTELPQDIQAAFSLYDKDGNIEHIMPKEDQNKEV